jgi:hypothetical protein
MLADSDISQHGLNIGEPTDISGPLCVEVDQDPHRTRSFLL